MALFQHNTSLFVNTVVIIMTVELTKYYYMLNIMEVSEEPNKHGSIISAKGGLFSCTKRELQQKNCIDLSTI